jgi:hypothetical protein
MTVLGKILVFVNLVFSLLTAGLIVMVYTTRTNWASAFNKQAATVAIVRAQMDAEFAEAEKALKAKEAEFQRVTREKQEQATLLTKAQSDLAAARQEITQLTTAHSSGDAVKQAQAEELKRRKDEAEKLTALVTEREQKIHEIDQQMSKLRNEKVAFQIQYESARARNDELLKQIQAKEQELAQYRSTGSRSTSTAQAPTPVPENFRGSVKALQGDLATITPGSDAGAAVGSVLQVYRLQPRPEYLGTLVIRAVTPHEAVGQLQGPKKNQVKVNDEVAARLQ